MSTQTPAPVQPLVSVVVPCFNAERWIAECVDSVLAQTYSHVELIVVNDGSNDESAKILEVYGKRLRVLDQKNLGGNRARNAGLSVCKGEFVVFLDADDFLLPNAIKAHVENLAQSGAGLSFAWWRHLHHEKKGLRWETIRKELPLEDLLTSLLMGWWIPPCGVLWRRSELERIGKWDDTFPTAQDTEVIHRAGAMGVTFSVVSELAGVYRRHDGFMVSTADPINRRKWHLQNLRNTIRILNNQNRLPKYQNLIASRLRTLSLGALYEDPDTFDAANRLADELNSRAKPTATPTYHLFLCVLGLRRTERLAEVKRAILRKSRRLSRKAG